MTARMSCARSSAACAKHKKSVPNDRDAYFLFLNLFHQLVVKHVEYADIVRFPRLEPAAVVDDDRVRAHPVEVDRGVSQLRVVQREDAVAEIIDHAVEQVHSVAVERGEYVLIRQQENRRLS